MRQTEYLETSTGRDLSISDGFEMFSHDYKVDCIEILLTIVPKMSKYPPKFTSPSNLMFVCFEPTFRWNWG